MGFGNVPAFGSIPACAGETLYDMGTHEQTGVYPRLCGGNMVGMISRATALGLSPLVRGKLSAIPP